MLPSPALCSQCVKSCEKMSGKVQGWSAQRPATILLLLRALADFLSTGRQVSLMQQTGHHTNMMTAQGTRFIGDLMERIAVSDNMVEEVTAKGMCVSRANRNALYQVNYSRDQGGPIKKLHPDVCHS